MRIALLLVVGLFLPHLLANGTLVEVPKDGSPAAFVGPEAGLPLDLGDAVRQWLQTHQSLFARRLGDYIRAAPLRGHEAGLQGLIAEDLRQLNLSVSTYTMNAAELSTHPLFFSNRESWDDGSAVIVIGEHEGTDSTCERQVILNGHVDVVPAPYADAHSGLFDEASNRVFGRGSTDMLGGLIASQMALGALFAAADGLSTRCHLTFQSVVEEESGGSGTLSTLVPRPKFRLYSAPVALIPEPTSMRLFPVQQGSLWFRVTVHGKTAHGGTRYDGISAIEKMTDLVRVFLEIEKDRNLPLRNDPLFSSKPIGCPINLGRILPGCGEWPSSVASVCAIEGRMGVLPGEEIEAAREFLRRELAVRFASIAPYELEFFGAAWPSGSSPDGHPMRAILEDLNGSLVTEASPWATDGGYLSTVAGIPALVLGPGDTPLAHQANESISMSAILDCAWLYAMAIARYFK